METVKKQYFILANAYAFKGDFLIREISYVDVYNAKDFKCLQVYSPKVPFRLFTGQDFTLAKKTLSTTGLKYAVYPGTKGNWISQEEVGPLIKKLHEDSKRPILFKNNGLIESQLLKKLSISGIDLTTKFLHFPLKEVVVCQQHSSQGCGFHRPHECTAFTLLIYLHLLVCQLKLVKPPLPNQPKPAEGVAPPVSTVTKGFSYANALSKANKPKNAEATKDATEKVDAVEATSEIKEKVEDAPRKVEDIQTAKESNEMADAKETSPIVVEANSSSAPIEKAMDNVALNADDQASQDIPVVDTSKDESTIEDNNKSVRVVSGFSYAEMAVSKAKRVKTEETEEQDKNVTEEEEIQESNEATYVPELQEWPDIGTEVKTDKKKPKDFLDRGLKSSFAIKAKNKQTKSQLRNNLLEKSATKATPRSTEEAKKVHVKKLPTYVDDESKFPINLGLDHAGSLASVTGLTNYRASCYLNSILQALVACPPFYNLIRSISELGLVHNSRLAPTLSAMGHFINEYAPKDNTQSSSFYASYVFEAIQALKAKEDIQGQQDADEVLRTLIEGLHEELIKMINAFPNKLVYKTNVSKRGVAEDNGEWKVVETKSKTGKMTLVPSPISEIFQGQVKTTLKYGETLKHKQEPFFNLILDIEGVEVTSIEKALEKFSSEYPVEDYKCPKTKQTIEASLTDNIVNLPNILILSLKRVIYDYQRGAKKVTKKISFPIKLTVPGTLETFSLCALIRHRGMDAAHGHYIAHVFHPKVGAWLECNDKTINVVSEEHIMNRDHAFDPYILFYKKELATA